MVWRFSGGRPVYQQVMEQIQGAVLSGEYTPGQKIPSVRDLAMEAQINPNTMQHALQELERTGLLESRGTSGRYVSEDSAVLEEIRGNCLRELTDRCVKMFANYGVSVPELIELLRGYKEVE